MKKLHDNNNNVYNYCHGVPNLLFNTDRMHIEQVTEFNFLGLIIDSNLNWKAHPKRN